MNKKVIFKIGNSWRIIIGLPSGKEHNITVLLNEDNYGWLCEEIEIAIEDLIKRRKLE